MRKIAISLQRYVWDPQNLARWRRTCLSSTFSVKSLIFKIQYGGRPLCYRDPFCIIMRCHDWRLSALIWTYNRCGKISVKNSQSSGNSARKPRREGVIFFDSHCTGWTKKPHIKLVAITLSNFNRYQISFTGWFSVNFAVRSCGPPCILNRLAMLVLG